MTDSAALLHLGQRLRDEIIRPMKETFVAKDEIIDLLGIALVAGEDIFLHGPPGTAKSALVHELCRRLHGRSFDYLLTRFTEPNELFGPFDIRRLREGDLVTNTEGMLPEASLVFLDELLNANSAILNSLLMALNERVFRRGRESRVLPVVSFVGASNHLPEDDALRALFDRFLLRVRCDSVPGEKLADVLAAGWKLQHRELPDTALSFDDIRRLHGLHGLVEFGEARAQLVDLISRIRTAGIAVSDRRAVRLQRVVAASALLCGRLVVRGSDLWVLKHIWDTEEQQEPLRGIVQSMLDALPKAEGDHPRSHDGDAPDADSLARDLAVLGEQLAAAGLHEAGRAQIRDQLTLLEARTQWVRDTAKRAAVQQTITALWRQLQPPQNG
ncbi:MAG TPA: AAA family ATPase [Opitutaceae bacterium]|nr:AAA family ATPase [Opitutaceae bacterium]